VADNLIDDMRKVSLAYFDRPIEEKLKLRMPPDRYRGYASTSSVARIVPSRVCLRIFDFVPTRRMRDRVSI
jgi:hypothetical protein